MKDRPAPLPRHYTEAILEALRQKLAKTFGVTLTEDHNGAWGPAGVRRFTLRFNHERDHVEVMLAVGAVSSRAEDRAQDAYEREDK